MKLSGNDFFQKNRSKEVLGLVMELSHDSQSVSHSFGDTNMKVLSSFDVPHTRRFVPSGCLGMSASRVTAPPENSTACSNRCGGSLLRPALKLEINEGEYPVYLQNSAALPRPSDNHCSNVSMDELSQKVKLLLSKRETIFCDDPPMENKTFERRRARLAKWMEDKHLTQVDVAARSGKTRSYVSLLLSAGKSFGEKTARHIEASLFMPKNHLDNSDESGLSQIATWERVEDLPEDTFALVPRIAISLSAGNGIVAEGEGELPPLAFRKDWLASKNITSRSNLRTCAVKGDSMEPFLQNGDTVLIDLGQNTIIDNKVYAIEHSGEVRIKRLSRTFSGGMLIRSDNSRYPDEQLTPEQAAQLRVIGACCWRGG